MSNTLAGALRDELAQLLEPLATSKSPAGLRAMLLSFGHGEALAGQASLQAAFAQAASLVDELTQIDEASLATWEGPVRVLKVGSDTFAALRAVEDALADPTLANQAKDLGKEIASRLIALYLRARWPRLHRAASALTLITPAELSPPSPLVLDGGQVLRMPWIDDALRFDRFGELLDNPWNLLRDFYLPNGLAHVADAHDAADRLFPLLGMAVASLGLRWFRDLYSLDPPLPPPSDETDDVVDPPDGSDSSADFTASNDPPPSDPTAYLSRRMPRLVMLLPGFDGSARLGVSFVVSSSEHEGGVAGIVATVAGELSWSEARDGWQLTAVSDGEIPAFVFGPGGLALATASTPLTGAHGRLTIGRDSDSGPAFAFGSASGSRLELGKVRLGVEFTLSPARQAIGLTSGVDKAVLTIAPGDGDGLLGRLLPSDGLHVEGNIGLSLSSDGGLDVGIGVQGSPLSGECPVGVSISGVRIDAITRRFVRVDDERGSGVTVSVGVRLAALLGPITVSLDGPSVGVDAFWSLKDPTRSPNLGVLHVDGLGLRSPDGVGLAVDGGGVSGGGFLKHDPASGSYAGALALSLVDVDVAAYGLVRTKLPSGAHDFSFLIVLSSEFSPGISLPFDFTLDGVGGILGVDRIIATEAVQSALWGHHFDGLLFPANPIAAAPTLLSTLDSYFPAAEGRYLLGPLAKIGWGSIVEAVVGLFVEFPEPLRVLLLGEIAVTVPRAEPKLELHIDFAGGVDLGKKLAFFDASLHESRIERYPIVGDLAFRYGWGSDPSLALAIGGFNPHFQPPANFPSLKRVAITVGHATVQLQAQAYLALTSNTLQFGASLELTASAGEFNVHGFLGFDALCERSPLSFAFDLSAGVDLRAGTAVLASVHLDGHVSGPSPWHIAGDASLSLLFFDISVDFDKTWGEQAAALPPVDPLPPLYAAFADRSSFTSVRSPTAAAVVVAAASPSDANDAVLLDPAGALRISQRVIPLGQPITRFAGTALGRTLSLSIDALTVLGWTIPAPTPTSEEFAPAQFEDLTDAEKLSLPSFSQMPAGVVVGDDAVDLGRGTRSRAVVTPLVYDTTIVDSPTVRRPGLQYVLSAADQLAMNSSTIPRSRGLGRYAPSVGAAPIVTLPRDRYVVAGVSDGKLRAEIVTDGSKRGTLRAINDYLASNPEESGQLQVLLAEEAA